jgi:hypothetical protein
MFWQSVVLGIQTLGNWHIWVGIVGFMVVMLLWNALVSIIAGQSESSPRMVVGCFIGSLGSVLLNGIAVSFFVVICFPIILFGNDFLPLPVLTATAGSTLMIGLKSLLVVVILSFVPVIGQFISEGPGVTFFLQGILVLRPIAEDLYRHFFPGHVLSPSAFPSFWLSLAYLIIGCVLAFFAIGLVAFLESKLHRDSEGSGAITMILGVFLYPVCGVLPLLMYGKYIALAVQSGMHS